MSSIKLFESRLKKEGSVLAAKCSQLKMQSADGIETVTTCHALKMVAPDRRTRQTQSKSGLLQADEQAVTTTSLDNIDQAAFPGTVLHSHQYLDSETIEGTLAQQYQHCMAFLGRNLHHVQGNRGFNSPGHLPNHLNTQQIQFGLSNLRNPALASHAFHILPYHGMGSGIIRALKDWPHIEFVDDRGGNQFRVILKRAQLPGGGVSGGVSGGVNHLHAYIQAHPGQRASDLATANKVPKRTIERWLKQLKADGKVEFKGTPKTGGYHCK